MVGVQGWSSQTTERSPGDSISKTGLFEVMWAWAVRVTSVEGLNHFLDLTPRVLDLLEVCAGGVPARPVDLVLQLAIMDSGVQYSFDFIVSVSAYDDWRRRRLYVTGDHVGAVGFKVDD